MVWGAIYFGGRSDIIFMERDSTSPRNGFTSNSYIMALEDGLLPIHYADRLFQQDNAPIHRTIKVDEWFEDHEVEVIDWPPHSPDLNPIEHVWHTMKVILSINNPELHLLRNNNANREFLKVQIQLAWQAVPQESIDNLIDSMDNRLRAVVAAKGWYTNY